MTRVAIIGASLAGHTVAVKLREKNKNCSIALITEESHPFYERRRLPDYLAGRLKEEDMILVSEDFYPENNIVLFKEREVASLNTDKKKIFFKDSVPLEYDFLVICSGRKFSLPEISGVKKKGVFRLYTLSDFKEFMGYLIGEPACIVGANSLAVSIAGIIAAKEKEVKLISQNDLMPQDAALAAGSISNKMEVIQSEVVEIIGEGEAQAIRLKEGKIIGISTIAFMDELKSNTDFLKGIAIEMNDDYISVDAKMRTNFKDIYACGAVCQRKDAPLGVKTWEEINAEAIELAEVLAEDISARG